MTLSTHHVAGYKGRKCVNIDIYHVYTACIQIVPYRRLTNAQIGRQGTVRQQQFMRLLCSHINAEGRKNIPQLDKHILSSYLQYHSWKHNGSDDSLFADNNLFITHLCANNTTHLLPFILNRSYILLESNISIRVILDYCATIEISHRKATRFVIISNSAAEITGRSTDGIATVSSSVTSWIYCNFVRAPPNIMIVRDTPQAAPKSDHGCWNLHVLQTRIICR